MRTNGSMDPLWDKVQEKQALQEAARRLQGQAGPGWTAKLVLSALGGLLVALSPAMGAAQLFTQVL